MALAGIDIGTTGCKCTIFNNDGTVSSAAYHEYSVLNPSPGLYELDPERVWESVCGVVACSVKEHRGEKITALCVSSFGEAAVPVDSQGRVLHNSLLYTDWRGREQCEELVKKMGIEAIMQLTGLHAHPMYTVCKVMWFRQHRPEIYKRTWRFLLFEDFILYRLGHAAVIDYSLASRTMAFNVVKKVWEPAVHEAAGLKDGLFSPAVISGTVVGEVDAAIAVKLGLPPGVMLVTGGHDQVCAAVGSGALKSGMGVYGIGTVECITPSFETPLLNERMLRNHFACVPHASDGMYVTYAFNFTGGSLLKWYRNHFGMAAVQEARNTGRNVYGILDGNAPQQPSGLLVLPHFAGTGTPAMDIGATGAILGLNFDTTPGQLYRAMLEGTTYEMRYNIECLKEAGIRIHHLRAVGGGARSDFWLQIKADIMGIDIETLDVEEAGTAGAAALAGTATGIYSSLGEAAGLLVKVRKRYRPNERNREIYSEYYGKYKKAYQKIKEIWE